MVQIPLWHGYFVVPFSRSGLLKICLVFMTQTVTYQNRSLNYKIYHWIQRICINIIHVHPYNCICISKRVRIIWLRNECEMNGTSSSIYWPRLEATIMAWFSSYRVWRQMFKLDGSLAFIVQGPKWLCTITNYRLAIGRTRSDPPRGKDTGHF